MMKKKLVYFTLVCLPFFAAFPQDGELRDTPSTDGVPPGGIAETRPAAANLEELTVLLSGMELELDFRKSYLASEAQVYTALYEGLFSYHPSSMEPIPAAASSWDLSEDKKQWTFTLREDARYNNGDPVKAADFRAAWISSLEMGDASPYSSLLDIIEGARDYRLGIHNDRAKIGIEAPDDRTLKVKLVSPASFFRRILCHHSFSPIHPSMLAKKDWSKIPLVSNGPFAIAENNFNAEKHSVVFERNENYWDVENVPLKKITIKYPEDGDEAAALWNSGEARWIAGEVNVEALTDRSGIEVNPMFATHYYFIRSARKPWNDWRLRRALAISIPWEELRKEYILPAKTLIFPLPGYPKIGGMDETNITEAQKLLKDSGHAKGKGLPDLIVRLTPSQEAARIGALMAKSWKENLGIKVKIEVLPYEKYFGSLRGNDYDIASSTWIGDFADPYTFLQMWRKDSNLNDARHNDSDYEKLIDDSMRQEGRERWQTLAKAEELLLDRGTVLPIYYSLAVNIIDTSEIDGWFGNALDIHPFKYLSFKTFRPLPGVALR
ncbi:MAG: peptide ABC transporter substrate-binding protein [Spirochaetaceae bacterium]|jgi:peptide/nickel transport system substrate-binding protein/oligopeptide transport system substrate-binding protein|nr:peptide ABC transporter substrate-binding protein [Spirochaetaceae bacterium]